jgi:hypothetical protein
MHMSFGYAVLSHRYAAAPSKTPKRSGHKFQQPPTHSYAEGIRRSSVKYIIRIYTYPSIKQKKLGCGVAQEDAA